MNTRMPFSFNSFPKDLFFHFNVLNKKQRCPQSSKSHHRHNSPCCTTMYSDCSITNNGQVSEFCINRLNDFTFFPLNKDKIERFSLCPWALNSSGWYTIVQDTLHSWQLQALLSGAKTQPQCRLWDVLVSMLFYVTRYWRMSIKIFLRSASSFIFHWYHSYSQSSCYDQQIIGHGLWFYFPRVIISLASPPICLTVDTPAGGHWIIVRCPTFLFFSIFIIYLCVSESVCICVHVCMNCVFMNMCISVCMCLYVCLCMFVHVYISRWSWKMFLQFLWMTMLEYWWGVESVVCFYWMSVFTIVMSMGDFSTLRSASSILFHWHHPCSQSSFYDQQTIVQVVSCAHVL